MMYLCPHCQVSLEIEEEWRGMEVSCPVCGKDFTICEASPKKVGMVTAWVLYGIFQLVNFCAALGWQIHNYSFYKDKDYWLETQSLRKALGLILGLSGTPTQIFIFLATIFTIIYMNRVSSSLATTGWLATLKRIKSAAVICGILFVASLIMLFLTSYTFLGVILGFSNETCSLINIFNPLLNIIRPLSGSLAIIFTVKYWIGKKSQINQ